MSAECEVDERLNQNDPAKEFIYPEMVTSQDVYYHHKETLIQATWLKVRAHQDNMLLYLLLSSHDHTILQLGIPSADFEQVAVCAELIFVQTPLSSVNDRPWALSHLTL